jgi:hypothetical protein
MTQYFAVIDGGERWGPFDTTFEPVALLKEAFRFRGHTAEEARYFFLHESSVERVETPDPE